MVIVVFNFVLCTLFPNQNKIKTLVELIFNTQQAKNATPGYWRYESLFNIETNYISIHKNTMQ